MHKYYLKITKYDPKGYLTTEAKLLPADSEQRLAELETQYNAMRYTNEDGTPGFSMYKTEDGTTGGKMYKTEVMVTRACPMSEEEWAAIKAIHGVV